MVFLTFSTNKMLEMQVSVLLLRKLTMFFQLLDKEVVLLVMVRLVYLCGVSVVLWVLDLVVQNGNPKFVEGKDLMNPLICVCPFVCPIIFIILARTSLIFFLNNLFGIARNCGVTFGGSDLVYLMWKRTHFSDFYILSRYLLQRELMYDLKPINLRSFRRYRFSQFWANIWGPGFVYLTS